MAPPRRTREGTSLNNVSAKKGRVEKKKENSKEKDAKDRAAMIKAARDTYNALSKAQIKKREPSPVIVQVKKEPVVKREPAVKREPVLKREPAATRRGEEKFEVVPSSLAQIRANQPLPMQPGARPSSIARRPQLPRPSLLPGGINIFQDETTAVDRQRALDLLNAHSAAATPRLSLMVESSAVRSRVRFNVERIDEQRESDAQSQMGDEGPSHASPSHSTTVTEVPVNPIRSILKTRRRSDRLQRKGVKTEPETVPVASPPRQPQPSRENEPPRFLSPFALNPLTNSALRSRKPLSFVSWFTDMNKLSDSDWRTANVEMLDDVIEMAARWKEALQQEKEEELPPVEVTIDEGAVQRGFTRYQQRRNQILADQECMLITGGRTPIPSGRFIGRHPMSSNLGHESPFQSLEPLCRTLFR